GLGWLLRVAGSPRSASAVAEKARGSRHATRHASNPECHSAIRPRTAARSYMPASPPPGVPPSPLPPFLLVLPFVPEPPVPLSSSEPEVPWSLIMPAPPVPP